MAVEIPGLSLSILRQQTRIQPGRPLLVSGRFTAFGLGFPAFIRVSLEGPSYDPQIRSFDTFASPFSGDYSINVLAEKGGSYQVYAQAFPPPMIPTGPPFPDVVLLLPPIAESTHPPLVVGGFTDTGVDYLLPDGTSRFLDAPPLQPIEFRPIITVAPGVTVMAPGVPTIGIPGIAPPPPPAPPAPPVAPPVAPPERITAALEDIRMSPEEINPGQEATGVMSWRNTSPSLHGFDVVIYTIDQRGVRHGPVQLESGLSVSPQVPQLTIIRFGTEGLPSGSYSMQGEIYDSVTGQLIDSSVVPYRLRIREIAPPVPPVPPVPPPPAVPAVPTPDILSQPTLNLLREIRVGDTWSGSVGLPTIGAAPFYIAAQLILVDPTGREIVAGEAGRILQPGETLSIPVNLNTTNFTPGTYNIFLRVVDQYGALIWEFPMGFLSLLEAIAPPPLPPEIPTAPTAEMIQTPFVNLPSQVTLGELWQGNISVPTVWPVTLPAVPSLPLYNFNALVQLQNPAGQRFDVARISNAFTPGQPINIPVNFDTSVLPSAGIHDILLNITDPMGIPIFDAPIGLLDLLPAPPLPPVVPVPPVPSEFPTIVVEIGPQTVQVGDTVTVPFSYTHVGGEEIVVARAAIGDVVAGVFDEVWWADKTIRVPLDVTPMTRPDSIEIEITPKFAAAGIYSVYAKINTWRPKVISPIVPNIIQVLEVPAPPVLPRADIADYDFQILTPGPFNPGDTVSWRAVGVYKGRAQSGSLTIALGLGSFAPIIIRFTLPTIPVNFTESMDWSPFSFSGSFTMPPGVELGRTYSVRARLEALEEPTQETDHDFNIIRIVAAPPAPPPPPVLPSADIADYDFEVTAGTFDPGDTVSWRATGRYKGRAQGGGLTISLGTGPVGTFITRFTLPSIPVSFEEAYGWTDFSLSGNFTIPTNVERGQTYSIRARLEAFTEPTQETDTDWGIISIAAAVPVGPSVFSNVSVAYPRAPVRIGESVSLQVNFMHQGEAESEWLYAAIGNERFGIFDEILNNRKAITVPAEAAATFHSEVIDIPVTTAIRPGTYDVYAKIGIGIRPRAISPTTHDVIRIV